MLRALCCHPGLAWALLCAGCTAGPLHADAALPLEAGSSLTYPLVWQADATSRWLEVTLPSPVPAFALKVRLTPADNQSCVQLNELLVDDERAWIPPTTSAEFGDYCQSCPQRAAVGIGGGLFVFPNDGLPHEPTATLRLRVGLRDCRTLAPRPTSHPPAADLQVRPLPLPISNREHQLNIVLASTLGSTWSVERADTWWTDAQDTLKRILGQAQLIPLMRYAGELPATPPPLVYAADNVDPLLRIAEQARSTWPQETAQAVLVLLLPCLQRASLGRIAPQRPRAWTSHIPGDTQRDAVFIALQHCPAGPLRQEAASGEAFGSLLAHELGHFLGLYHVEEADGRKDHLADTTAATRNLMWRHPHPQATTLSDQQRLVLRSHAQALFPTPF